MTTELVKYQSPLTRFQPQTLEEIVTIAKLFESSGMFPTDSGKQTAAQLAVKILAGQEIGLTPFASANGMQIIKGKCTPSANIMAAKVKGSGRYDYRVTKMTDTEVSIDFYEHGKLIGTSPFTVQDATKAGTQNMGKFPRNMLFARAMSNGVKWFCADVFNGVAVYTPDEMGATVDYETGEIIESAPQPGKDAWDKEIDRAYDVVLKDREQRNGVPQPAQTAQVAPVAADDILSDKGVIEAIKKFIGELRGHESPGAKKADSKLHGFAVGVIDGITGKDTHRLVFQAIFNRQVTKEQPLAAGACDLIFKRLVFEKTVKDAEGNPVKDAKGKNVKEPNPDFDQVKVEMIHDIHAWALAQAGQMTIDQGNDLVLGPKTGAMAEADGDRLWA